MRFEHLLKRLVTRLVRSRQEPASSTLPSYCHAHDCCGQPDPWTHWGRWTYREFTHGVCVRCGRIVVLPATGGRCRPLTDAGIDALRRLMPWALVEMMGDQRAVRRAIVPRELPPRVAAKFQYDLDFTRKANA